MSLLQLLSLNNTCCLPVVSISLSMYLSSKIYWCLLLQKIQPKKQATSVSKHISSSVQQLSVKSVPAYFQKLGLNNQYNQMQSYSSYQHSDNEICSRLHSASKVKLRMLCAFSDYNPLQTNYKHMSPSAEPKYWLYYWFFPPLIDSLLLCAFQYCC